MRVVFASHRYYPVPGGTERLVQTIAEGLVARGHSATVVTQREPGSPVVEEIGGVTVRRIRVHSFGGIRWPRAYHSTLRSIPAEVFHLHGNRIWCADFYFPWAQRFDWPQLLTGHGFYQYAMHPRRFDRWYFERYLPRAIRKFGAYAAVTEYESAQLVRWGVPADKLHVVPNGIRIAEFGSRSTEAKTLRSRFGIQADHVAVYAGGFFENKRVDRLVEAIHAADSSWALVAVGRDVPDSPYSSRSVQDLAQRLGVELVVTGPLPRPETVDAIQEADVVALGSEYEGFGLLLLEGMAAGRPFVSWRAGAAPELARRGAGIVVSSTSEMAAAFDRLAVAAERTAIGSRAREVVEDYSEARMVDAYLRLYDRLAVAH